MAWRDHAYGFINVPVLLEQSNGEISIELSDSAVIRSYHAAYRWDVDGRFTRIESGNAVTSILTEIPLTYDVILLMGLYAGDGNKTGNIGFSQREITITAFVHRGLRKVFGENVPFRWNLLEDTKRFLTDDYREQLRVLEEELVAKGFEFPPPNDVRSFHCANRDYEIQAREVELMKAFIRREFEAKAHAIGMEVDEARFSVTVSPCKGALSPGQSALEYIQGIERSRPFLPLWLKILNGCVNSILENRVREGEWLLWREPPQESSPWKLDVECYINSHVRWLTSTRNNRYSTSRAGDDLLRLSKRGDVYVEVYPEWPISPFELLHSGLYLAEGGTKKETMFELGSEVTSGLRVSFTSSEERLVLNFLRFLNRLGPNLLRAWKVKIGKKYSAELDILAQKRGVLPLMGGEKGQGYLRTMEVAEDLLAWAEKYNPGIGGIREKFSHVESTGVGIPRVDIHGVNSTVDVALLTFIRDLMINPDSIEDCLVKQ